MSDFDKYSDLFSLVRSLCTSEPEKNIFSIGGRGHFENPASDMLAFFISPDGGHGLDKVFLICLLQCMKVSVSNLKLETAPEREVCTHVGNRIDIIIEGHDWVIVIENKLEHSSINPFDDYVRHAKYTYGAKRLYFVLLYVNEESWPAEWIPVSWREFSGKILENLSEIKVGSAPIKWPILAREFVLNVQQQCGGPSMSDKSFRFVLEHYAAIEEVRRIQEGFFQSLMFQVCQEIGSARSQFAALGPVRSEHDLVQRKLMGEEWFRFYFAENTVLYGTNIVLRLRRSGRFTISIYVYHDAAWRAVALHEVIKGSVSLKTKQERINNRNGVCFFSTVELDYEHAVKEAVGIVERLTNFFSPESSV